MHSQLLILIALTIAGLGYFLFVRKVFDFVSAGFIGQLIYFSPGFYGYLGNPYFPGLLPSVPIIDSTFLVWNVCLATTLLAGALYRPTATELAEFRTSRFFDFTIVGLLVISWVAAYLSSDEIFSSDKAEVLQNIDRTFLLFAGCCQISTIAFTIQKKWLFLVLPAAGLAFLLYAGFRAELAISAIAIATYWARKYGIFAFARPRALVPALLAIAVLIGYKPFLTAYRLGNWQVLSQLQMSDNLIDTLTLQFEPFLTQAVLNEALLRQFQVAPSSLLVAMTAALPFLGPALDIDPIEASFNFQDYLFPNIPYGLTASPQTQFIAAFGFPGLLLFVLVLNALLVICSRGLNSLSPYRCLFALGAGAFFAFYVQRNDFGNSLTMINRMFLTIFICWLGSWILSAGNPRPSVNVRANEAGSL